MWILRFCIRGQIHFDNLMIIFLTLCSMVHLHCPTPIHRAIPVPSELGLMIMFRGVFTGSRLRPRPVLCPFNTDLGAIPLTSIVIFSVQVSVQDSRVRRCKHTISRVKHSFWFCFHFISRTFNLKMKNPSNAFVRENLLKAVTLSNTSYVVLLFKTNQVCALVVISKRFDICMAECSEFEDITKVI